MLTAVVIFLSKYLSKANEKINNEKTAISKDGIKVNSANETIYYLFATDPLTLILFFIEFLISINISTKNKSTRQMFDMRRISRLSSLSLIKLL